MKKSYQGAHAKENELNIPIDIMPALFRVPVPGIKLKSGYYHFELIAEQDRLRAACQAHLDAGLTEDILGNLADKYLNER